MNDLSMGAHADAHADLNPQENADATPAESPTSMASPKSQGPKENVWQSTFNPGRNYKTHAPGRTNYDHVDDKAPSKTTWEMVLQSQNAGAPKPTGDDQKTQFKQMDNDGDGFIDAKDLRSFLGPAANVDKLIKQADRNNDGRIDYNEFTNLLKTSMTKQGS